MIQLACSTENLRTGGLEERARVMSALGIRFAEVIARGPNDPVDLSVAEPADIRDPLARHGLTPVSLYTACLDIRDADRMARSIGYIKRAVDLADALGIKRLVMTPFGPGIRDGYDYRKLAEGCREIADHIGDKPVMLCLENHPGWPLTTSSDYEALFEHLDAPQVGITMDFAHFVRLKEDPLKFAERWSSRIRHIHLKDADEEKTTWFGEGKAPIREIFAFLNDRDFNGYASLELEIRGVECNRDNLKRVWDYCVEHYA